MLCGPVDAFTPIRCKEAFIMTRTARCSYPGLNRRPVTCRLLVVTLMLLFTGSALAAQPTIEMALKLTPTRQDVQYDRPTAGEAKSCSLKPLTQDGAKGWIVLDAAGNTLRRFIDNNKDNIVDQWCYFQNGVEVFRDIDSNFNRKVDQHRWLNTAGTRWGVDSDEDGTIDRWRRISAQEVTAELVRALGTKDTRAFASLILSPTELNKLGLGEITKKKISTSVSTATTKFKRLAAAKSTVTPKTKWVHFSASQPGVVPAGTDGSTNDLHVYENVVAMVETDGKQGFVQVGTMVRSDDAWRLIDAPSPATDDTTSTAAAGIFFQAPNVQQPQVAAAAQTNEVSAQLQKLLNELDQVERRLAAGATSGSAELYNQQADILEKLVAAATDATQKTAWLKQLADNISAAVQSGQFPAGVARLEKLAAKLQKDDTDSNLVAYVRYRGMLAEYSTTMQNPKADFAKIQTEWIGKLETFVDDFSRSDDAPEAMLQIAIAQEFAGDEDEAKKWYRKIVAGDPASSQSRKATGAIRRLESVGKAISFRGQSITKGTVDLARYRGRTVVLHYWASWCEPCKADMVTLRNLVAKYGRQGFSVIGVNVDMETDKALAYLKKERFSWANVHEPGGLESRPATELGVLTLPTMLLIDDKGRVVNRNIHVSELETELKNRIR